MDADRIHRAVSADGTEVAGRVTGEGPPLVLLHGALYDGETAFSEMLPYLEDAFTCYLPSTRGKGLSGASPEVTFQRMLEDVVGFVDSIDEPVPVAGWSGGGMLALGAAAHSDNVAAVVAYEPPVFEELGEEGFAHMVETTARMSELAGQGRMLEAALTFAEFVTNAHELEAILASGRLEDAVPNITTEVQMFSGLGEAAAGPTPTAPEVLASITVPVLLLLGAETAQEWFPRGARYVAGHVAGCQVRTLPGVGHSAPSVRPEAVAAELVRFLEPARQHA